MYNLLTITRHGTLVPGLKSSLQKHCSWCNFKHLTLGEKAFVLGGGGGPRALYYHMVDCQIRAPASFYSDNYDLPSAGKNVEPARYQSTSTTNAEVVVAKKKKRSTKPRYAKYVELLEVTNLSASERKSRVKRLKAKKLQEFISKTQAQILSKSDVDKSNFNRFNTDPIGYQRLNVEALDTSINDIDNYDSVPFLFFGTEEYKYNVFNDSDKIKNILTSFHNFRDVVETIEQEANETDIALTSYSTPEEKLYPMESVDPLDTIESYIPTSQTITDPIIPTQTEFTASTVTTKASLRYKLKSHVSEEQERLAKQRSIRINLYTYLNICVSAGLVNRGYSTLLNYRQRNKKYNDSINPLVTIDLYNILLHGYAEKGAFDRIKELLDIIEEDKLIMTEQSFAAIFECLGRSETSKENIEQIKEFIEKANKVNLSLNQIFDRSVFMSDQRNIALDAIHRVEPDFSVVYTPPALEYDNLLLNKLNQYIKPVQDYDSSKEKNLKTSMKLFEGQKIMNAKQGFSKEELQNLAREQLKIELDGCIVIDSIEKGKQYENSEIYGEKLKELEKSWRTQIHAAVVRDMNTMKAQLRFRPNGSMNYHTYLKTLDTSQYVDLLIKEAFKLAEGSETYSATVGQLYKEMGIKVQQMYQVKQKKKNGTLEKIGNIYGSYCELWESGETSDNSRQSWQRLVHENRSYGPCMNIRETSWPTNVLCGVGRFLYNILMRDIKIDTHIMRSKSKTKQQNILPAFYTLFRNHGRLVKEEVKPHPVLARLVRTARQKTLTFDSNLVPMLCPPQPWNTPYHGGYLLNKSDLIRLPFQAIQQWERINGMNPQNMYPALDSLNQLAAIPWRVNTDLLDIIINVFQNGGNEKLDVPSPPSSLPALPSLPETNSSLTSADRAKVFKDKMCHRRKQAEMYSLWCDALYRLSLANHFRDKVFWLPHNMDFRGRVYPLPPHLNHLGSDLARSLLTFDQKQPLGPEGFNWLKLHCINLTGLKKRDSIRERLLYAEDMMPQILDSADNPLTGDMWWAKSDEPWQTLGCCIEIAKVHRSPDPTQYLSSFPIHQDGSCNGLQHYAALGRDEAGAFSVNLASAVIPQDVYSSVAVLVEKSRKIDAENGLHVAEALEGFVKRKVIKQTVMTTVYGVTRYGARLQIARQLKDIDNFPKDWVWPASTYLTTKTFESLREMFTSTREIQDWFTECARLISGVCLSNVEWITPLGLPVVQPYSRQDPKHNSKSGSRIREYIPLDMYERPNVMKQKNAFPPNFIHSLDSSHMMLTSLHCERKGLTFISVHDCFWTHASTVPEMNKICREQFVALHSQPILEDLSKFMRNNYAFKDKDFQNDGSSTDLSKYQLNRELRQVPLKGDFDLRQVLDSVYFFS